MTTWRLLLPIVAAVLSDDRNPNIQLKIPILLSLILASDLISNLLLTMRGRMDGTLPQMDYLPRK